MINAPFPLRVMRGSTVGGHNEKDRMDMSTEILDQLPELGQEERTWTGARSTKKAP